jgi:septal ring factor EnvC (AmiA/AmiB activator)
MASHSRLGGVRRARLSPEAQAELELAESLERARQARRWAYFSTVLAFFAAAGAAVVVVLFLSEDDPPPPADSRGEVRDLRGELSKLSDEMRRSSRENRSTAEGAEESSRRVSHELDELDRELSNLSKSGDANDRRLRKLGGDVKQLKEEVDRLGFDGAFP